MDVRGSESDTVPQEPSTDPEPPRPPPVKANGPEGTSGVCTSIPSSSTTSSGGGSKSGLGGISIVSSSAEGAGESSMQFSTRPPSAEQPGFMGTWQQQGTDSNLLYRMSQQVCQPYPSSSASSLFLSRNILNLNYSRTKLLYFYCMFKMLLFGFHYLESACEKESVCMCV